MELNNENYFSKENRTKYMSASLFKEFLKCEKNALAQVRGEVEEKKTDALLFGSYVDAYFSNELDEFEEKHPEMFNPKTGEFKAPFKNVETVIKAIEEDELLLKYLKGDHQVVIKGTIEGVPFKGKIDSFFPNKLIVDQKVIKDLEPVWVEKVDENGNVRNVKVDFIEAYGYAIQGAIYQYLESQQHEKETGEKRLLPFVLAVTTKEEVPVKKLIRIDQEYLDEALEKVKAFAPRYWKIMNGEIEPVGCGKCSVCRKDMKVQGVESYKKLFHTEEIEY